MFGIPALVDELRVVSQELFIAEVYPVDLLRVVMVLVSLPVVVEVAQFVVILVAIL